jgi:O-antigen/teichoic acid export membrane protein
VSDDSPSVVPKHATRPAARGFLSLASSRVVATVLLFVAFAVTASALGPSGLGTYAFGLAALAIFAYLADFGFQTTVNRDVAQQPGREPELIPNLAYLRLLVGIAAYAAMAGLLTLLHYSHSQREAAMVAGVLLVTLAMESGRIPLQVRLRVGWPATVEAFEAGVFAGGSILLAALHAGPIAFLWLYVGANTLTELLIIPAALRLATLRWRPRLAVMATIGLIAWPVGLVNLITTVYYGIDTLILAFFHSSADVGQYGAAYRVLMTIDVIPSVVMVVVMPVLSQSSEEGRELLQRRVRRVARLLMVLAVPIAIGGALTAQRAFTAIPGFSHYGTGGTALAILLPAGGFIFLAGLAQAVLLVRRRERILIGVSISSLLFTLVLCFTLIPPFSLIGAAVATTVTEFAVLVASVIAVRRAIGVRLFEASMFRLLGPAGVLLAVLVPGYLLPPLAQVAVGGLAYLLALPLFGAITWRDLEGFSDPDGPVAVVPAVPGASRAAIALAEQLSAQGQVRLVVPASAPLPVQGSKTLEIDRLEGTSLRAWRRALKGASACRIVTDGLAPRPRVALAARLAGCPSVLAEQRDGRQRRRHPIRRRTWRALLDADAAAHRIDEPLWIGWLASDRISWRAPILDRWPR